MGLNPVPFGITDSHLGGVPYVPRDGQIPTDKNGHQLWLCAQINFSQLPELEGFPKVGIFQLFLSDWHLDGGFGLASEGDGKIQDHWRAVYYPDVDETVTEAECLAKMAVPWEEGSRTNMPRTAHHQDLEDIGEGYTYLWRTPSIPLKINFGPAEREAVSLDDFRFHRLFDAALAEMHPEENPESFRPYGIWDQTEEEREALHRVREQSKNGGCKIGGFPLYLQGDPRENAPELEAWDTLLLQLDEDLTRYPAGSIKEMDLDLSGGTLNVLIRSEDLARRDFSRLIARWSAT